MMSLLASNDTVGMQVFVALAHAEADLESVEPLVFYQNVSTDKELRDASNDAELLIKNFNVDADMRVDVFVAKKTASTNIKEQGVVLDDEEKRLVEKMLLDGIRAGLDLPEQQRDELMKLKKELSQICVEAGVRYETSQLVNQIVAHILMSRKTLMKKMYLHIQTFSLIHPRLTLLG